MCALGVDDRMVQGTRMMEVSHRSRLSDSSLHFLDHLGRACCLVNEIIQRRVHGSRSIRDRESRGDPGVRTAGHYDSVHRVILTFCQIILHPSSLS